LLAQAQATEKTEEQLALYRRVLELEPTHRDAQAKLEEARRAELRPFRSKARIVCVALAGVVLLTILFAIGIMVSVPELYPIDNVDINGSYVIGWSDVGVVSHYVLGECMDDACASPREFYSGPEISYSFNERTEGHYCYCVKACRSLVCSGWSNVECVDAWRERETNNLCLQANGPLISGGKYYGHHDWDYGRDASEGWDCFWIDLQEDGQVSATLITQEDRGLQLHLFDQNCDPVGPENDPCYDPDPPYELGGFQCTASKGRHHVCIHTIQPQHEKQPYALTVTFPGTEH
jgi:hypothetical protein